MRVLIVDDEPVARQGIRQALRDEPDAQVVGECSNGRTALEAIRESTPDLLFLDIHIPVVDGIDVASRLANPLPLIIFTTAFEQYALDAFAVRAVDYLVKPWRKERFQQALTRARFILNALSRPGTPGGLRLPVASTNGIGFVETHDVELLEAAGNYVSIQTPAREHLVRGTIEAFEARLQGLGFIRIHRSRLVNKEHVTHLQSLRHGEFEISLRSGRTVRSARSLRGAILTGLLGKE